MNKKEKKRKKKEKEKIHPLKSTNSFQTIRSSTIYLDNSLNKESHPLLKYWYISKRTEHIHVPPINIISICISAILKSLCIP